MPKVEMVELCMAPEIWELVAASLKRHHPGIEFFDLPSGSAGTRAVGIRPANWRVSASPEAPHE